MTSVDGQNETLLHAVRQWLRNPSNWLSLGSIVISAATFLYVQFYPGQLTIYMPKRISVTAPTGAPWQFLVNTSLFNEAPSTKVKIVEDAALYVRVGETAVPVKCPWTGTTELLVTEEYAKRFGEVRPEFKKFPDQFAPAQRALPFALLGRELQTKMLLFTCPEMRTRSAAAPADSVRLETTLEVMTPRDTYTSHKRSYQLEEKTRIATGDGSWGWIE
jgi:hypothetical protein